jgi:hypothetical protein
MKEQIRKDVEREISKFCSNHSNYNIYRAANYAALWHKCFDEDVFIQKEKFLLEVKL